MKIRTTIQYTALAAALLSGQVFAQNTPAPSSKSEIRNPKSEIPPAPPALPVKPLAEGGIFSLEQFGPIASPVEAKAAFSKASAAIVGSGGGVLIIPIGAASGWVPDNISQEVWRKPAAPAPARSWGMGPGVTVLDFRGGTVHIEVPQLTGIHLDRTFNLPPDESCGHWSMHPTLEMDNHIIRGTTSYRDWLLNDVAAGKDQRFYLRTIRGVFPGMFLTCGDYNSVQRLYVKSISYDDEKKLPYLVADTDAPLTKGVLLHNKNHANQIRLETFANTENQTFDVMNWRHDYSQGDTYMFDAKFAYMSDVHSTAGDENGVVYAAFVQSETTPFRGTVEAWNPAANSLKFTGGSQVPTLGTGRPIINMNPAKWVTGGTVSVGRGGPIRFSKDAPVTPDMAGRYFALDAPDEFVPKAPQVRRWYMISSIAVNEDGTKDLTFIRHFWGAKPASGLLLYNPADYSQPGIDHPLKYIITPGANLYDVSHALGESAGERTLLLAPGPRITAPNQGEAQDSGHWTTNDSTNAQASKPKTQTQEAAPATTQSAIGNRQLEISSEPFAPGDAIEQAIGPEPFRPIPFRTWIWESVPSAFPSPVIEIANFGEVSRGCGIWIRGGSGSLDEVAKAYDRSPRWDAMFRLDATANNGIIFGGDVTHSALYFNNSHGRAQPIKWNSAHGETSLTVAPDTGVMHIDAPNVALPGGVTSVGGISATDKPAANLRGINLAVKAGTKELTVTFGKPEADADYAVFVQPSFLTHAAVTQQTAEGFTVQFDAPPAADGKMHWMIVR